MLSPLNTCLLVIDLQERMVPAIDNSKEIVKRAAALVRGMKLLDVPVIATEQYARGLGRTVAELQTAMGELVPFEKTAFSCMKQEGFPEMLKKSGCRNVVAIGVETHICVLLTVQDLAESGYNVYLAADCCGSRFKKDRHFGIERMRQLAVVATLESVLFELMVTADHPKRKEIQKLITDF